MDTSYLLRQTTAKHCLFLNMRNQLQYIVVWGVLCAIFNQNLLERKGGGKKRTVFLYLIKYYAFTGCSESQTQRAISYFLALHTGVVSD